VACVVNEDILDRARRWVEILAVDTLAEDRPKARKARSPLERGKLDNSKTPGFDRQAPK
jgi:hypothetical protein